MHSASISWMLCSVHSSVLGPGMRVISFKRNLAESSSSRNWETCKGNFRQSKVGVSGIRQKGKCSSALAKIKCAKTVFIRFIPLLEWLYRRCSCKKLKLFLNMVSWWFRNNCKYMLWVFFYIYIYTHSESYEKCIWLLVKVCQSLTQWVPFCTW